MVRDAMSHRDPLPPGVTPNNLLRSVESGIPFLGGIRDQMQAVTEATLSPALNQLFGSEGRIADPTFWQRYDHSMRNQGSWDLPPLRSWSVLCAAPRSRLR
jgi:hypothetical protein